MTESALQLLVLVRFLCFVAVVYLGLHIVFSRLISKPDSKILWFFSIITLPLDLAGAGVAYPGNIRIPAAICRAGFLCRAVDGHFGRDRDGPQIRCIERLADISRRQYSGMPFSPTRSGGTSHAAA